MARPLDTSQLRAFRKDVAALKRSGILGDLKPSTSTVLPSTLYQGKPLKTWVKVYDSATPSGGSTSKVVSLPKKQAETYKKLDYISDVSRKTKTTAHVLVPTIPGTKVKVDKEGKIHVTETSTGITVVHLPVKYHNLEQYVEDVLKNAREINRMKRSNERFGFQFFGSNSRRIFPDIQELMDYLTGYRSIDEMLDRKNSRWAREAIQNLVIIKGPVAPMLDWSEDRPEMPKPEPRGRKKASQVRKNWPEWKREQYREKRRLEERKRRAKLKKKRGKK